MKRIFLISLFACFAAQSNAQVPFVHYTPVIVGSDGQRVQQQQQQRQQERDNFQTVNAYFVNRQGNFEKIRIKISVVQNTYGSPSVYVRGYYDKTYERWRDTNSRADKIDVLDNEVIKENFDYKCYIQYIGYVYF